MKVHTASGRSVAALAILSATLAGCAGHGQKGSFADRNFKFDVRADPACHHNVCFKPDPVDEDALRKNGDAFVIFPSAHAKRSITWKSTDELSIKIDVLYPLGTSFGNLPTGVWVMGTKQGNQWVIALELDRGRASPELVAAKYSMKVGGNETDPIIIVDR